MKAVTERVHGAEIEIVVYSTGRLCSSQPLSGGIPNNNAFLRLKKELYCTWKYSTKPFNEKASRD
jgi:hypothetical protein